MRVVPESSNHDVLLFGVDSDSSLPDSTGTLHVLTMRTAVCVFWAYKAAPVPPVSRLLQAGISAILPIDIDSAQFRAALSGVRHGLQVVHPLLLQRK
ncbi:MAG TPA: hypothetical protein VFM77_19820, partial [Terriglobales bacterium]|nr:hypothetical protein [Terriglobales bacterium]